MKQKVTIFVLLAFLLFGFGCASQQHQPMYSLSVELNKLTTAAEGYEHFIKPPVDMSDEEFLKKATEHDPGLLRPFEGYRLNVVRKDGHVSILVCSKKDGHALLQDIGCTGEFDQHIWKTEPPVPCGQVDDGMTICTSNKE